MDQSTVTNNEDCKFLKGGFVAMIKVSCNPREFLNLRPVITVKGDIIEWQLLISDPSQIDWKAVSNDKKPTPGSPILTPMVIRFHPNDIVLPLDVENEFRANNGKEQEESNKG